jgi:hypothetical protein
MMSRVMPTDDVIFVARHHTFLAFPPELDEHEHVVGADGEDHETPEEVERAYPVDFQEKRVHVVGGDQRSGDGGHRAER